LILKLGALAGAIAAVLGLIFLVWPNLRPQPSPSVTSGKITQMTWEQPYGGDVHYYVDVDITGYNGQTCVLAYSVYTSNGQYTGIADTHVAYFQAQSDNDTGGATIGVSQPSLPGSYYVLFTLYAPNQNKLDAEQTSAFNVP
jgi:hypothetical protein